MKIKIFKKLCSLVLAFVFLVTLFNYYVFAQESYEVAIESVSPTPVLAELTIEPTVEPTVIATPVAEIITSKSDSIVEVENDVNSIISNSEIVYHILNIYLEEVGDINISLLLEKVMYKVYEEDKNLSDTVSLKVTTIDNFSYVENTVNSISNSGGNNLDQVENASIITGDAYSAVSVVNNVNTNIIDSKLHLVTVNIYGSLKGDIILPEFDSNGQTNQLPEFVNVESNSAVVSNTVNSLANSGQNAITTTTDEENASTSAMIISGEAKSNVNIVNIINSNLVDLFFRYFYINNSGYWVGGFLGFNDSVGGMCTDGSVNIVNESNDAFVSNNINSYANTGGNTISGGSKEASISTGNAYSSVSLLNIVNSNIINSQGFIGFVNIFGSLIGDIGGASTFVEEIVPEVETNKDEVVNIGNTNGSVQKESGGVLEVSHSNNVGTHVFPGDTITFVAKVNNVGYGKIYGAKLKIELFKDGVSFGGTYFDLGDINAQRAVKLTTGLVMSKNAIAGKYKAVVSVNGSVGPDDNIISASSESEFTIKGFNSVLNNITFPLTVNAFDQTAQQVLGTTTKASYSFEQKMVITFAFLLLLYLMMKLYQKRAMINEWRN